MAIFPNTSHTPSPGRRERKRQQTREQIVAAAAALFAEREYDSVTVDEIAERADVVKGTLYAYFPAKDDLASAVYNASLQPVVVEVNRRLGHGQPALTLLETLFDGATRQAEANPLLARTVYSRGMSQAYAQPREAANPSDTDDFVGTLERIVAHGQATGALRRDAAIAELAVMLAVLYATTVWLWAQNPTGEPLRERVQRCLRLAREGMRSPIEPTGNVSTP